MIVILLNCFTLGMYQPCSDKDPCTTNKCLILQRFDEFIFAFFSLEMTIKMIAMGVYGPGSYLADSWNRLDLFIVIAGAVEYGLPNFINFSAIRTIRVLRPLRAINRIPSMRILVMLLLDTLPMLGNVLLLCFFVFFIFGIIGVQLWQGILRQRCVLNRVEFPTVDFPEDLIYFYKPVDSDYICSKSHNSGMHFCANLPNYKNGNIACTLTYEEKNYPQYSDNDSYCVNWNQYYTLCSDKNHNPFQDTISFDNIGLAWIAIFLVISLEGWTEIMYYIQDGHSFWDWIYFVLLIVIGSFFMINLCLVVIATQFSETKKREMERMRLERARFQSSSTLASSTNNSEPSSCYAEIIKYIAHLWRRSKRKVLIKIRFYILRRNQRSQLIAGDTIRLNYGKQHHPNCSKLTLISSANLLSPASVSSNTRRSSVMFSDLIILHGQNSSTTAYKKNVCSSEKTTQAGDGNIWQIATASDQPDIQTQQIQQQCNNLMNGETLTCQELLALGAINAALSTGQILLDIFFNSITKGIKKDSENNYLQHVSDDNFSCCQDLWQCEVEYKTEKRTKLYIYCCLVLKGILKAFKVFRKKIKKIVVHKCFQEGILVAILINTLSMGIEHHNQAEILTHIVEVTNIIFSAIFGVEMLLKIIAEGPFGYISNGFNVFDGIIVVLSAVELFRNCTSDLHTDSGLSVLRTFRLLRILKLVRFMPNLRRQLFVMLRTMDNVAIFFSLLILFIFIFSILGMYLFGGKFCVYVDDYGSTKECTCESMDNIRCRCDRKHFNNILWATVTVFQILTQEDWNIVLSNGMAKTSNWAALYFVALMTFGNYVLFNLLVAILVEGFSSERNERREREQRELAKRKMSCIIEASLRRNCGDSNYSLSSSSENCFPEYKNYWKPDEARNVKNLNQHAASCDFKDIHLNGNYPFRYRDPKSNIQKESLARLPIKRNSKLLVPPKLSPPPSTFRQFKHSSVDDSNSRVCKIVTYNEKSGPNTVTYSEKVGPAFCTGSTKHLASRSSWEGPRKVATKSSFKKSKNVSEVPAENIPLNNGRHHSQCSGKGQSPIPAHLRRKNYFKKTSIQENQVSKNSNVHAKKNNTNTIKFVNKSNEKILPQLSIDKGIKARIKKKISSVFQTADFLKNREDYSLYLFSPDNKFRKYCCWVVKQAWFDNLVLIFIAQNCITLAMERPNIPPDSPEKIFLQCSNYIFSIVFATEMFIKVVASGMCYGPNAYFTSGWNVMDGSLVIISVVDIIMFLINDTTSRIFGILRVFRLLRSLRPLRVINRAPGLKLVVQTLLSSLRPIGNIVLICCTFFIIFGILGVQPKVNYSEWRLLYFIAFILLVGFFVLNMFVGVVVENFHRCREEQEKEEKIRKAAKRALQMEKRRRSEY
uniref:Voltage-dependent T-type calcium channel subunit alpha-1G-like n=1 Tax=Diabrotica virgifera virgifera TaxID=50390 RepID=A0A6P7GCZ7_DIAVI